MTFKKDYINYLLYTVVNTGRSEFKDNYRLRKLVDSILSVDDVMKVTYLAGKTAGLEILFKYLLYISDKIDKSHVTIFNLKDNFEYDVMNLTKICQKISQYKSENVQEAIKNITEEKKVPSDKRSMVKIDVDEDAKESNLTNVENIEDVADESEEYSGDSKLTLIENVNTHSGEAEVFELDSINDSIENSDAEQKEEVIDKDESVVEENAEEDSEETEETSEVKSEIEKELSESNASNEESEDETEEIEHDTENEITSEQEHAIDKSTEEVTEEITEEDIAEKLPEVEIIVHKPISSAKEEEHTKEEAITSEAYYKFEGRFFEEVKILEKLFSAVDKDCKTGEAGKLGEKCLQGLTEIIEITSELSSLSRQLSFDLIADIFLTMNLYFTKAISHPKILTGERIKLFDSSLALVNSLIKGEDYLNYDNMVDKIEKLKSDISGTQEEEFHEGEESQKGEPEEKEAELTESKEEATDEEYPEPETKEETQLVSEKTAVNQSQMDSANFKLKYLIKEFEKSFTSIDSLKGEYIKFDALEKISELNNILRLIAKISASVKLYDVLKLAEVTYVFLKYVKDYRMNLLEPEIKQIIKYIIFTFKMLLTNRKPEDFNVLVQHLNNPVKIFTDT